MSYFRAINQETGKEILVPATSPRMLLLEQLLAKVEAMREAAKHYFPDVTGNQALEAEVDQLLSQLQKVTREADRKAETE